LLTCISDVLMVDYSFIDANKSVNSYNTLVEKQYFPPLCLPSISPPFLIPLRPSLPPLSDREGPVADHALQRVFLQPAECGCSQAEAGTAGPGMALPRHRLLPRHRHGKEDVHCALLCSYGLYTFLCLVTTWHITIQVNTLSSVW
jgi:hypothetical protein